MDFMSCHGVYSLTFVNQLQLGDDVQTNIREFILEHLQEHRKEMGSSPK